MAGLVAAEVVPVLLLGPVAGVVIDRFDRKAVLIAADLVRAALALSLVRPLGTWHPYAVAAGLAVGSAVFNPTAQAVIPALTTEGQRLAANSVAWSTGRLVQILGAATTGGLIGLVGTGAAFALNAATFLLPRPRHRVPHRHGTVPRPTLNRGRGWVPGRVSKTRRGTEAHRPR